MALSSRCWLRRVRPLRRQLQTKTCLPAAAAPSALLPFTQLLPTPRDLAMAAAGAAAAASVLLLLLPPPAWLQPSAAGRVADMPPLHQLRLRLTSGGGGGSGGSGVEEEKEKDSFGAQSFDSYFGGSFGTNGSRPEPAAELPPAGLRWQPNSPKKEDANPVDEKAFAQQSFEAYFSGGAADASSGGKANQLRQQQQQQQPAAPASADAAFGQLSFDSYIGGSASPPASAKGKGLAGPAATGEEDFTAEELALIKLIEAAAAPPPDEPPPAGPPAAAAAAAAAAVIGLGPNFIADAAAAVRAAPPQTFVGSRCATHTLRWTWHPALR